MIYFHQHFLKYPDDGPIMQRNSLSLFFRISDGYVLIAVYLFMCMRVTRITQKVLNRIA